MEKSDNNSDEKTVIIQIGDKICEVNPKLWISDIKIIEKYKEKIEGKDYRLILAEIITSHTKGVFELEEICHVDDNIFRQYIEKSVVRDSVLNEKYNNQDIVDNNERYIIAVEQTSHDYLIQFRESFRESFSPMIRVLDIVESVKGRGKGKYIFK